MFRFCLSLLSALLLTLSLSSPANAQGYSASFDKANITEFIDTISATLGRTIIIDPSVTGTITVRSYSNLTLEQYYQLFLSVLEMHGYGVVEQSNNVLKVIKSKDSKSATLPLVDTFGNPDDSLVTWVLPVNNVPARELAPILRQMNANYGNVVNFNPSNILVITGRAGNVERLVNIVRRIDQVGAKSVAVVGLSHTSAKEMSRILTSIYLGKDSASSLTTIVANEQGNQIILSGTPEMIERMRSLALQLDSERAKTKDNNKVFYLRYARAESLKKVLEGAATVSNQTSGNKKTYSINAHEENNALIISAQPALMKSLESLIEQLDIRRAQVMVEAIIAEVSEADGIDLSLQLASSDGALMQFNDGTTIPASQILLGLSQSQGERGSTIIDSNGNTTINPDRAGDYSSLANTLSSLSGVAFSISSGNWASLIQAVSSSSESNVLSTPSLMTLDNQPASFVVGDEVPTITGSTSGDNNDNPYQTIERRQVGVKLQVTPQINEGDAVRLDIEQEVSNVNGRTAIDVTFSTREVKTSVMVRSGDTVVISGIMDDDVQESESKVPLLGDIPILGHLFRSTSSHKVKRNLMVFIRPTIIRDDDMMKTISADKYSLIRAEQLENNQEGINLMPFSDIPVLPEPAEHPYALVPEKAKEPQITPEPSPLPAPEPEVRKIYHTVIKGDTLYSLAKRNGISVTQLMTLNQLKGSELEIGQRLVVAKEFVFAESSGDNL